MSFITKHPLLFAITGTISGLSVVLYRDFNSPDSDPQARLDMQLHPFASVLGSMLPALILGALTFFVLKAMAHPRSQGTLSVPIRPESAAPVSGAFPAPTREHLDTAGEELASNRMIPGLWAKALMEGGGEKIATEAAYIKLRIESLEKGSTAASEGKVQPTKRILQYVDRNGVHEVDAGR